MYTAHKHNNCVRWCHFLKIKNLRVHRNGQCDRYKCTQKNSHNNLSGKRVTEDKYY